MPDKGDALLLRLRGDRKIGFAGDVVVNLDEIPSLRFQVMHSSASLNRVFNDDRVVRMNRRWAIDNRATCNQPRAQALSFREFLAPAHQFVRVTSCVAYAGCVAYAVSQK